MGHTLRQIMDYQYTKTEVDSLCGWVMQRMKSVEAESAKPWREEQEEEDKVIAEARVKFSCL